MPRKKPVAGRFSPNPAAFIRSLVQGVWNRKLFAGVERFGLFVGHPRSGHTLVGALLDAHPQVVLAHELNVLRFVREGYNRLQLYSLLLERDIWFARRDFKWQGYSYAVPGQWQGKFEDLRVIGDKKAAQTTGILIERPGLLQTLRRRVGVPLRVIHVVRNPFDNIARMSLADERPLAEKADYYFRLCAGAEQVRAACGSEEFIIVRHEDLIAAPEETLAVLCGFLGVPALPDFTAACAGIVFPAGRRTRDQVEWPAELAASITGRMGAYDFLAGYEFDAGG
jgi:hypothetical protein